MADNTLKCETCGKTHFETPIVEKPLRVCYRVKVFNLPRKNVDGRKQDNTCLDCLDKEIKELIEKME